MEIEQPFKTGFLFMPPQSFLRKAWTKRFCALYKASSHGIQRLEIFDNDGTFLKQSKSPSKIIALSDCVKVTPMPQKQQANVFEVRTKTCSCQFSADSFQEMTEWLGALQAVAFGAIRPSSGPVLGHYPVNNLKQEENLLYSSMDEPEVYSVKALNTEAMLRNDLLGDYKLIVTSVSISVAEDKPGNKVGKTVLTWPYRHIRRYGCSKDNFSFEAGRKCLSGEGLFAFETPDGSVIFQSVDAHVSLLKSSQSDCDAPSSPFLDDDKNSTVFSYKDKTYLQGEDLSFTNNTLVSAKSQDMENPFRLESEVSKAESSCKSIQPVPKPPRKSKQNPYVNVQTDDEKPAFVPSISPKSGANFSLNLYDEPDNTCQVADLKVESAMDKQNQNCDTQVLNPRTPKVPLSHYEPIYAVLEEKPVNSFNMDNVAVHLENSDKSYENIEHVDKPYENVLRSPGLKNREASRYSSRRESDCYDHLSLKKFDTSRSLVQHNSPDHIYGKLLTSRPASTISKSNHDSTYGILNSTKKHGVLDESVEDIGHCYTNIHLSNSTPVFFSTEDSVSSVNNEPKHFLRNNAEYAKVFKNRK